VIPRPMYLEQRAVTCAIAARLMVDPAHRSPFAAIELLRTYLSGRQDISYTDGATMTARRVWETLGASLVPLLSIKWARIVKPLHLAVATRSWSEARSRASILLTAPGDAVAGSVSPFRVEDPALTTRPLSVPGLLAALEADAGRYTLRPVHTEATLEWLIDFMADDPDRGKLVTDEVLDEDGKPIGWYAFFSEPGGVCEVVNMSTDPKTHRRVLSQLIFRAKQDGGLAIQGRMLPRHLDDYWENGCFGKRSGWALIQTGDTELRRAVMEGDAYLQGLEGEMPFPLQRRPAPGRL